MEGLPKNLDIHNEGEMGNYTIPEEGSYGISFPPHGNLLSALRLCYFPVLVRHSEKSDYLHCCDYNSTLFQTPPTFTLNKKKVTYYPTHGQLIVEKPQDLQIPSTSSTPSTSSSPKLVKNVKAALVNSQFRTVRKSMQYPILHCNNPLITIVPGIARMAIAARINMLSLPLPKTQDLDDETLLFFKYFASVAHPNDLLKRTFQAFYWACNRDPYLACTLTTFRSFCAAPISVNLIDKNNGEATVKQLTQYSSTLTHYSLSFKGDSITYKVLPPIPFQTLFQTAADRTLTVFEQQPDFPRNHESVHDLLYYFFITREDNSQIEIPPCHDARIEVFLTTLGNLILANEPINFDASMLDDEIKWADPFETTFFVSNFSIEGLGEEKRALLNNRAKIKCFKLLSAASPDTPFSAEELNVLPRSLRTYQEKGFLIKVSPDWYQIAPEYYEEFLALKQEIGPQEVTYSDVELVAQLYNLGEKLFTPIQRELIERTISELTIDD